MRRQKQVSSFYRCLDKAIFINQGYSIRDEWSKILKLGDKKARFGELEYFRGFAKQSQYHHNVTVKCNAQGLIR
jgi:hypothetical protein